ncbi:MAG: hypothetical protein ACYDH9_17235 [Limisphaerales bacterium]
MPKRNKAPELTFQEHIAKFLVREHTYGVLEQSNITDTEHFIAEDRRVHSHGARRDVERRRAAAG